MPLIDDEQPIAPVTPTAKIVPDGFKTIIRDTSSTSVSDIISHIEGSKWEVTFYQELTTAELGLIGKSGNTPSVYQNLRKIEKLELRVQDALSFSFDTKSSGGNTTGSALMYPGVVPNVGNTFVARLGDGKYGVFQLTAAEPKSLYLNTAYQISYTLLKYYTEADAEDYKKKTVTECVFVKSFMSYSRDPVITKKEYAKLGDFTRQLEEIKRYYCEKFFNRERNTFLIPGQPFRVLDTYLVRFLLRILTTSDHPVVTRVRNWSVGDAVDYDRSIWDAILERDRSFLYTCFTKANPQMVSVVSGNNFGFTIRLSGIDQFMAPLDREVYADTSRVEGKPTTSVLINSGTDVKNMLGFIGDQTIDNNPYGDLPLITTFDALKGSYVVSESFYSDMKASSLFEAMLCDFIDRKSVNTDTLAGLVATYHGWGLLERFYYLPILIAIMTTEIVNISY